MTNTAVNATLLVANAVAVANAVVGGNPLLEYVQNGASVGAVMAVFLWREVKRADRYEKLYDEERKMRIAMCLDCKFARAARDEFIEHRVDEGE